MIKTLNENKYNIFSTEDFSLLYENITEEELMNMYNEIAQECELECGENAIRPKDIIELRQFFHENFGYKVERVSDIGNTDIQMFIKLIKNAIHHNTTWVGETDGRGDKTSFYKFSIKPLMLDDKGENVYIQIRADRLCPLGISDNGIHYIRQYNVSVKYLTRTPSENVRLLLSQFFLNVLTRSEFENSNVCMNYVQF